MQGLNWSFYIILGTFFARHTHSSNENIHVKQSSGTKNSRPHIFIIIADDLGFNDVGFHGSPQIPTPNLDALAFSGIILNNYYVSPICTPSRSALFTGKHPIHTGMQHDVIYGTTPFGLSLKEKLLPEFLRELNYSTHLVGKWHLGHFRKNYTPTFRGFDSHFGHWTGHKDYYDNMAEEKGPEAWGYDHRRGLDVSYDHWGQYTTDVYTEESILIIRSHAAKIQNQSPESSLSKELDPLFLVLSHTAVHSANPYKLLQAPASEVKKFAHIQDANRRVYAAMVSKLDESVGRLVGTLSETGMLSNSIIIFTTDNGGPAAGFNGNAASNWPLRGVKNTLYEGGVRGAAFIWSPLLRQANGRVSTQLMHIQDWLPSIVCGVLDRSDMIEPLNYTGLIGINMWDAFQNSDYSPRYQLLHNIDEAYGNSAVRKFNWKLMHGTTYNGRWDYWYGPSGYDLDGSTSLVLKRPLESQASNKTRMCYYEQLRQSLAGTSLTKINNFIPDPENFEKQQSKARIVCHKAELSGPGCTLSSGEYCLFDLSIDPCEYKNVAAEFPNVVEELKATLKQYQSTAVPPRNKPKEVSGMPKFWNYTWTNWMDY